MATELRELRQLFDVLGASGGFLRGLLRDLAGFLGRFPLRDDGAGTLVDQPLEIHVRHRRRTDHVTLALAK